MKIDWAVPITYRCNESFGFENHSLVAMQLAIDGKSVGISLFEMDLKKEIGVYNFTCLREDFRATLYGGTVANESGVLDL